MSDDCGKKCDHESPCILADGHEPSDRHETAHGCVFFDSRANQPGKPDSSPPRLDTLSKSDFERLGCEDISGPQLRARVFDLEALASELALTLEEMMSDLDGLDFVRPIVMIRAQEALESARERLK